MIRKPGHKVRLGDGPAEVACTNILLDDQEQPSTSLPEWLDTVTDVSDDERWTGAGLAR